MTNINIAEWTPDQVAQWLSGLEDPVLQYIPSLKSKGLNGKRLLLLRSDDLDYLGVTKIGHQEVILEAVEQLRHFHYESDRECIQQLAMRVSTAARSLIRSLAKQHESKLQTQTLADTSRLIQYVKQLICWMERWAVTSRPGWRIGGAGLVRDCVDAATAAHRDTFADRPATTILHTAHKLDSLADFILQEVNDPVVATPLVVWTAPPHAPLSPQRDHLIQVGSVVVIGWPLSRVRRECESSPPRSLLLRGPRRPPGPTDSAFRLRPIPSIKKEPPPAPVECDSDESGPLSPPPSPTVPHINTRESGSSGSLQRQRRYTVCGGSPRAARAHLAIHQFWRDLKHQKWANMPEDNPEDEGGLSPYRRDKALSCSTGLERPNTHLGLVTSPTSAPQPATPRARLDKTQSTPPYEFRSESPPLAKQVIPESPSSPGPSPSITVVSAEMTDQILDFKKSSSQIQEAMKHTQPTRFTFEHTEEDDIMETINISIKENKEFFRRQTSKHADFPKPIAASDHIKNVQNEIVQAINEQRIKSPQKNTTEKDSPPEPPPRPQIGPKPIIREPPLMPKQDWFREMSTFKPSKQEVQEQKEYSPLKPVKNLDASQISLPLQHITKYDLQMMHGGKNEMPALNSECMMNRSQSDLPKSCKSEDSQVKHSNSLQRFESTSSMSMISPAANVVKGFFPNSKTRSLKKKNSLLAKGRNIPASAVWSSSIMTGVVKQRGRGARAAWKQRYLVLHSHTLLAYRHMNSRRACSSVCVAGWAAEAAEEVRSQQHCFKLYSPAHTLYFATTTAQDMTAWIQAIQRASMSEGGEEAGRWSESSGSEDEESKDRGTVTLDRAYLKLFSRTRHKEDKNKLQTPVSTEQSRTYRRAPLSIVSSSNTNNTSKNVPRPVHFIHASNPNLLDFEKTDFVAKPNHLHVPKEKLHTSNDFIGFVTLEEFMLQKQAEERRQVYTNRVLMGIERDIKEDRDSKRAAKDLQKQLDKIIPDVIYGELPTYTDEQLPLPVLEIQNRSLPKTPDKPKEKVEIKTPESKPISVKGKDGYETIVYPNETVEEEPPKLLPRKSVSKEPELPRKPVSRQSSAKENNISRKCSIASAKDLGYEVIYDDDIKSIRVDDGKTIRRKSEPSDDKNIPPELKMKSSKEEIVPAVPPRPPHTLERARAPQRPDKISISGGGLKSAAQYTPLVLPPHSRTLQPHREFPSEQTSRKSSMSGEEPTPPPRPQPPRVPSYRHLECPPVFEPETYSLQPPHNRH